VSIGRTQTVEIPPRVYRGRLTGFLFETDKTFLLPNAMHGIVGLKCFYEDHPGTKLLVNGHTDTMAPRDYNLGLSVERADSVTAFLRDDVEAWMAWYVGKSHSKRWGTREDQYMLRTLHDDAGQPFYAGPVNGALDGATLAAIRRFQSANGLAVDGIAGPITRRELVRQYMAQDDTTLPAGTVLETHGCGEHHLAVPTGDQVEEQRNRRVEVFFFDGEIDPPPRAPCPSPNGCPEYPEWVRRSVVTVDFDEPLPTLSNARWEKSSAPAKTKTVTLTLLDFRRQPVKDRDVTVLLVGQDNRAFGHTDGAGQVTFTIPEVVKELAVRYAPEDSAVLVEVPVALELPPISDDQGVIKRLTILGYPADTDLAFAVYLFQRDERLAPPTCRIDAATRQKVAEVYGA
jgi:hypothetical protein